MDNLLVIALYFLLSICVSLICTPLIIKLSEKLNFFDGPKDQKRLSEKKVSNIGGIPIFFSMWIFYFLFEGFNDYILLFFLSFSIFLIGLYDDYINLRPLYKFSFPFIICLMTVYLDFTIEIFDNYFLNIFLSFIWIYGLTNSFNFLDNMDGITPGVIAIICSFISYVCFHIESELIIFFIALSGLNLGFLYYNFNPAKIYLGDNGSLVQGYLIAVLLLEIEWGFDDISIKLFAPVLLLGYTIVDTTYVTVIRTMNGNKPWIGDTNHTTHKLVKLGFSVKQTSVIVYSLTMFYCSSGILLFILDIYYGYFILFLNIIVTFYYFYTLGKVKFNA